MAKAFVIDVAKCSGCYNCQLACKDEHAENDWTPYAKPQPLTGQFWCRVTDHVQGTIPKVRIHYIPRLCNHCKNAPCMAAAENGAVYRREDGLIIIDPETTHQLEERFMQDTQKCDLMTEESLKKSQNTWHKFKGWFGHLLTFVL